MFWTFQEGCHFENTQNSPPDVYLNFIISQIKFRKKYGVYYWWNCKRSQSEKRSNKHGMAVLTNCHEHNSKDTRACVFHKIRTGDSTAVIFYSGTVKTFCCSHTSFTSDEGTWHVIPDKNVLQGHTWILLRVQRTFGVSNWSWLFRVQADRNRENPITRVSTSRMLVDISVSDCSLSLSHWLIMHPHWTIISTCNSMDSRGIKPNTPKKPCCSLFIIWGQQSIISSIMWWEWGELLLNLVASHSLACIERALPSRTGLCACFLF